MCLEELNAPPFLRFVGDAHDAESRIVETRKLEDWKNCGVDVAAEGAHT